MTLYTVGASTDDAAQHNSTGVNDTGLGNYNIDTATGDNGYFCVRFTNVAVANAATVYRAFLQLPANNSKNVNVDVDIHCQASDNAPTFNTTTNDISGRSLTAATVTWTQTLHPGNGTKYESSPDLSSLVQEVVNRAGWTSGNAIVFICVARSTSVIQFSTFDNAPTTPAQLDLQLAADIVVQPIPDPPSMRSPQTMRDWRLHAREQTWQNFPSEIDVTQTQTPTVIKSVGKEVDATQTQTPTITKLVNKFLTFAETQTASLAALKARLLTLTVTQTQTATMVRQVGKIITATQTQVATIVRSVGKIVTVTQTQTPTVVKQVGKALAFVQTQAASLVRQAGKIIAATETQTPTIGRSIAKTVTVVATQTATIVKQITKTLTATQVGTATLAAVKSVVSTIKGLIGLTSPTESSLGRTSPTELTGRTSPTEKSGLD